MTENMKRIITYIAVVAAIAAVSCTRSEEQPGALNTASMLMLNLDSGSMATRSDIPDAEPVVSQFDWFFYPDATGTSAPIHHGHFTVDGTDLTSTIEEPSAYTADEDGKIHLGFNIETNFSDLKGTYYVYVLANYEGIDHSNDSGLTLKALLAKTMQTNFDEESSSYSAITDFVMDSYSGNDEATYPQLVPVSAAKDEDGDGKANLAVGLRRVAAKITFVIHISESAEDSNHTTWRPLPTSGSYTAYMVNTVNFATVAGVPVVADENAKVGYNPATGMGTYQTSYATSHVKTATDDANLLWEVDPFYTYPVAFDASSNNAPYIKICLPWENVDDDGNLIGNGATLFYYKAYILDEDHKPLTSFDRNTHYTVALNIDTLGGTQEDYTTLDTHYYVADWQAPYDGTFSGYFAPRYLDVPRDTYYIYGEDFTTIAVTSSHNISASIESAQQKTLAGASKTVTYSQSDIVTNGKSSFTLTHELDTDLVSGKMDVTPIVWTVKVYHEDKESLSKEITIIQYPSIYAELWDSSGYVFINSYSNLTGGTTASWAFNNNKTGNPSGNGDYFFQYSLGKVEGQNSSYVTLKKFTVINVSSLASLSDVDGFENYRIGDPRVKLSDGYPSVTTESDWERSWRENDLGWNGANQTNAVTIPNYLIAEFDDTSIKANFIAPKVMISSGYGKNQGVGNWKTNAERCAAYQEAGYPAGRWRLPSEAEIVFFRELDYRGYLGGNNLFVNGTSYWCSTKKYYTASETGGTFASTQSSRVSVVSMTSGTGETIPYKKAQPPGLDT